MKKCFKCSVTKDLCEFYKHSSMKDGHLNKCKECTKADATKCRNDNIDHYREYDRKRGNRQEKGYLKEWRKNNPKKYKAHSVVNNAIQNRKIKRKPCEICKAEKAVAHHDDYDYPLDIRWLCQAHHKQWHAENGEGANG